MTDVRAWLPAHMTELILFHHAQGLTDGVRAFADELRAAGHDVHTPDLYEGMTFARPDAADTLADYDERATALLTRRLLAFLEAVG
jgi:dienelactone hydrolase